jgi:hypothetical protein
MRGKRRVNIDGEKRNGRDRGEGPNKANRREEEMVKRKERMGKRRR